VTLHRPSNVDDPAMLQQLMGALTEIARDIPILFPAHPRAQQRLHAIDVSDRIIIVAPFGYLDFLSLEADASLVLTDSGGIQEETTVLGVPCLTLRTTTERPITINEGTNRLVGTDPDAIVAAARDILVNGFEKQRPALWDGHAAARIADVLLAANGPNGQLRPTDLAS
jgi:UDP-N-acetylglucosamine 2-epimerase (non-hydrolysing)